MFIFDTYLMPCSCYSISNKFEVMWIKMNHCHASYYVACCYPPKPRYDPNDFITEFCSTVETIITNDASPVIVVTGDFNSLPTGFLEQDYGLTQLVCTATHGNKVLDKIFTNRPDLFTAVVCKSLLKTKHSAVIVRPDRCFTMNTGRSCNRTVVSIYDHRTHHIDRLRCAIGFFNWSVVTLEDDITVMYSRFLSELHNLVKVCIPVNRVRLGPRDPPFITPLIKFLLRKRNRLYHKGRVEQANELAIKINSLIVAERSKTLSNLENATPKQLWAAVDRTGKYNSGNTAYCNSLLGDVNRVNDFFASISFSHDSKPCSFSNLDSVHELASDFTIYNYEIEPVLRRLKPTAPGLDQLPTWLFKKCSVELSDIVAYIMTRSFSAGIIPNQWKCSVVTPVPKVPKPQLLSDFRPISVTPILSRIAEKLVVRRWLYPSICPEIINDQFAFRPTGSTTCALVFFIHHLTRLLETNSYVRCLLVDFSKAFDVIDHSILATKLEQLNLPSCILKWIGSFLTGRSQQVKYLNLISTPKPINRSIVQGSGIGPTLYIVMEGDLRAL